MGRRRYKMTVAPAVAKMRVADGAPDGDWREIRPLGPIYDSRKLSRAERRALRQSRLICLRREAEVRGQLLVLDDRLAECARQPGFDPQDSRGLIPKLQLAVRKVLVAGIFGGRMTDIDMRQLPPAL